MRFTRVIIAALALVALGACADSTESVPPSEAGTISLSMALTLADITSVSFEITAADIRPAITGTLTVSGGVASGTVSEVPAGDDRLVKVLAYAGSTQVCEGEATVDVVSGETATADILLECDDLVGDVNVGATIPAGFTSDAAFVQITAADIVTTINVPLSVTGQTVAGLVENVPAGSGRTVSVTTTLGGVAACTGTSTVNVTSGATADATGIVLTCGPTAEGAVDIDGMLNFRPNLHAVVASDTTPDAGTVVALTAVATDPDGDTLTFAWSDGSASTTAFSTPTAAVTNYTVGAAAGGSTVTLTVTVSDGLTTPRTGTVVLTVGSAVPGGGPLINELYYDPSGSDAENAFIEIWGPAGFDLNGYVLVGVNGSGGVDYQSITLTGTIPANGLYVVAHTSATAGLAAVAQQLSGSADYQNGDDAVQLRTADGAVVDALAYGPTAVGGEGTPAQDVDPTGNLALTRDALHTDTNDNATDFVVCVPTPSLDEPPALGGGCAGAGT